ncbi:MAG: hypothetical protein Harvfovirus6_14 [Harvfovirus sp.]|uniref:Uncharacterized protein n=1 Tax=Harvfovirus sp. TaxID=2487768 RepID=A0A3G5A2N5_9VIRU|nr:MAG: hypothetical protein Harvfovirus6_14 [Harvfovirus sp.]
MAEEKETKSPPPPPFGGCMMRRIIPTRVHPGVIDLENSIETTYPVKKGDTLCCKKCHSGLKYEESARISYRNYEAPKFDQLMFGADVPTYYFTCNMCRVRNFVDEQPFQVKVGNILQCNQCYQSVTYQQEFKTTPSEYLRGDEVPIVGHTRYAPSFYHKCSICRACNEIQEKIDNPANVLKQYALKYKNANLLVKTSIPTIVLLATIACAFLVKKYRK